MSGAAVKSERVSGGKLVISFAAGASRVSLTAAGPLLNESKTLRAKARRHRAGHAACERDDRRRKRAVYRTAGAVSTRPRGA